MESGRVFIVFFVNLEANRILAPSMASLRAIAGAFPPKANLAPGVLAATFVKEENKVAFLIYLLWIVSRNSIKVNKITRYYHR